MDATERAPTVLVVEDDPDLRMLAETVLREEVGAVVELVATGADALEAAHSIRPDLILLDIRLPDFGGDEVVRRLRADPATRGLRAIAVTAATPASQAAADARAAGFDGFLAKPYDVDALLATVRAALGRRV